MTLHIETFEQRTTREALEAHRRAERNTRRPRSRPAPTPAQPPTTHGKPTGYQCPELRPFTGRPGAMQAYALPSRVNNKLHHPDGRVTDLQGQLLWR